MKTKSEKPSPAEMHAAVRRHVAARQAVLNERLGLNVGAVRERARLEKMLEAAK